MVTRDRFKASFVKLREKLITSALEAPEFRSVLENAAEEITRRAKIAPNEATVEAVFENVLYYVLKEIGVDFFPEKERIIETRRHTRKGRTDSRVGLVIIEYKHSSKLKREKDINLAKDQLFEYMMPISETTNNEVVGFITDGLKFYELRVISGELIEESGRYNVDVEGLLTIIRIIVSLGQSALTAGNLIKDFCGVGNEGVLFDLARKLRFVLKNKATLKTKMLRSEWEELFRLAHDDVSQQKRIQERRSELSKIFDIDVMDAGDEYGALFALHTAYAIVLKIIAFRVVSDIRFGAPLLNYKSLIVAEDEVLRSFCTDLEDGEIFRRLGILNLLEGDFFSWYSDHSQWEHGIVRALREVLKILSRYEGVAAIFSKEEAIDLFRELYEATVPKIVRASFGEFFTPLWLANHVLETAKPNNNWDALDPCCGSGTFIIAAISRIKKNIKDLSSVVLLDDILKRVAGIDLNPLAVLTTRIHYFIHISDLLPEEVNEFVIPVYLGDSSYVPERVALSGIECLRYNLTTLKDPIEVILPVSLVEDTARFVKVMQEYEKCVKNENVEEAANTLIEPLAEEAKTPEIKNTILNITGKLVGLEKKGWNGIWARILTNFLTTGCIKKRSIIMGNPPWIDWKNLPSRYRETVKSLCIDKGLFSGAGRTGGINLNICALITHVAASNWLLDEGRLAFLMPKELAYQASYEGWRGSVGGYSRDLLEFHDWSKSGHPFVTSKEDFMTYVLGPKREDNSALKIVPVTEYVKKEIVKSKPHRWRTLEEACNNLDVFKKLAGQIIPDSTAYTFVKDYKQLRDFSLVTGDCAYVGREGIEFYPQELFLFRFVGPGVKRGTVFLENIQSIRSKYNIPKQTVLMETKYLFPLVKGPEIRGFAHRYSGLIVPFPYKRGAPHKPITSDELASEAPLLLSYYNKFESIIRRQTGFSDKIRGPDSGDFYGLARTGPYSFKRVYVAFRDNTKWCAVVITPRKMPWGGVRRFVFQNHAVSMCERKGGGGYITEEEAHYLCAILNAPIVEEFILATSDPRSFKIRPPVYIPVYNPSDRRHKRLSELSETSHSAPSQSKRLLKQINYLYLAICKSNINN